VSTIEGLDDYIKSIRELTKFDGAIVHPRLRWWFRCQQDWSWDLRPGVYRPDFDSRDPLLEEDRLTKERHLFREFNEQARPLVQPGVTEQEMYFIQQHYGMPTRLLDWSIDPLVALYFASEDFSREEDCTSEGSSQTDGWLEKSTRTAPFSSWMLTRRCLPSAPKRRIKKTNLVSAP